MDAELNARLNRIEELTALAAKNILNIKDASVILGRSEKTIRNRLEEIPHYYGPLGLMFRRDELENWMCAVKCQPINTNLI